MHPLPKSRRRQLAIYRAACRVFGPNLVGSASCLLYRSKLLTSDQKSYYVLSTRPLIIYLGNVMKHTFEVAELFRGRPVHFIKNFYHTFEKPERLQGLKEEVEQFWRLYPEHRIYFVCATKREREMFSEAGLEPCYHINKNAFVDEQQYRIIDGVNKSYDAVYNGQLALYKRHELAAKIDSLALIVYRHNTVGRTPENDEYGDRIRTLLAHADWLNDVDTFIPPVDIPNYLNQARVGLALSAEEGPMAACMEYLLCGLPVVSTPSLGGREEFLDNEYSLIVPAKSEDVAAGVVSLIARGLSPHQIRNQTIDKMKLHRVKFVGLVNTILAEAGAKPDFAERFEQLFVNKLRTAAPFPGALLKHSASGMPIELCKALAATRSA